MVAHAVAVLFTAYIIYVAWPGSSLFSWHPTFMVIAFILCMFEALLVFNPESSVIANAGRMTKATVHVYLQVAAIIFAALGFLAIFYNKYLNDKPHFATWHALAGLSTLGYTVLQATGGAFVKHQWIRNMFGMKSRLADLKLQHATSGLVCFTFATATIMFAFHSNWFIANVNDYMWYACHACISCIIIIIMNQITSTYLPQARSKKHVPQSSAAADTKTSAKAKNPRIKSTKKTK